MTSRTTGDVLRAGLWLLTAVMLPGCATHGAGPAPREAGSPVAAQSLAGELVIETGAGIGERDTAVITLVESGTQDAVATTRVQGPAGPKIPFTLDYDTQVIRPSESYVLEARVIEGNNMKYTATRDAAVRPLNHPQNVVITMRPAS